MALTPGTKLGPYEIVAPLGAGGMGEVYRARDTRLGRDVALKVLPESFALDPDRLHRFAQETQAIAVLNHPNILAIHDVGQHQNSPFLVLELLEGESLRELLEQGPLPQRKVIDYGVQIAQGLAAAHEKGIVHRDLKPDNLFITRDGRAKVLDFGLAKLASKANNDSNGLTLTGSHTAAGVVMGTASYMAPEQVRGEPADARADIFAFGAVLYEMLSGRRAFRRDTPAETMTAVLREDPPELTDPERLVSPALDKIVRRCLEKVPGQRFQSAQDLSFALGALSGTDASAATKVVAAPRRVPLLFVLLALLAMAVGSGLTWLVARHPVAVKRQQFAIPVAGEVSHMALSADGSTLVFVSPEETSGLPMLYVQRIGSATATPLAGTEGASYPFWSPDGANIGFFANGKMLRMASSGGTPQALANVQTARGGTWGRRDVIVYAPNTSIEMWRTNADGSGAPTPLTDSVEDTENSTHRWPVFLPDGNHFLFFAGNFGNMKNDPKSGIYVSSLDGKEKKLLVLCHSNFAFDSGHLFYANEDRQLVSLPFDPAKMTVSGSPTAVAELVGFQPSTFWAALTASENGTVVYNTSAGAALSVLTWIDRTGKELGRIGAPAVQANPTISPDGDRIAVDISDQKANNVDVWIEGVGGASNTRITFDPAEDVTGVWSRDGKTLAYRNNGAVGSIVYVKPTNGLEREQGKNPPELSRDIIPNSWSLDGQQILCTIQGQAGSHLGLVHVAGGPPTSFLEGKGNETNGQISPDGKWVTYASDESGIWEIYVTTFPAASGKWQVSRGGGSEPRWRGDGNEIFYLGPKGMLNAVPVNGKDTFSTGAPVPLFQVSARAPISSTDIFTYDVSKDGTRFLVDHYLKPDHVAPLNIVLNAGAGQ